MLTQRNKMSQYLVLTILILCVALSKGQQQLSIRQQQQQQLLNDLFAGLNVPRLQASVPIQKQPIQQQRSVRTVEEQSHRPITFPAAGEAVLTSDRIQPVFTFNTNLLLQNVHQELSRPAANQYSRYTDDQFDYVRDFAWTLFQVSKLPLTVGNLVLSPIQPQLQLSLLRTVATGLTEEEIAQTIKEVSPSVTQELMHRLRGSNGVSKNLGVASAVFVADTLKLNNSFIQEASNRDIDIKSVNFNEPNESSFMINNWVSNATNNYIKNIFKPDPNRPVRMLLANTIYFNGEWKYGFNGAAVENFETTEKLVKNVTMMKNSNTLRSNSITLRNGFTGQWVEIPYRGDEFSMVIVVPKQRHFLDEFIRSMSTNDFQDILKQLSNSYKKLVHLSMPKFSVSSSFSVLNSMLKMGTVDLFSRTSQLPYLATNERFLRVDDILQQGVLSVDERGTVASVATISHVVTLSLNSVPEEVFFKIDQPFLSIIVDKRNKIPIFISKIYDP